MGYLLISLLRASLLIGASTYILFIASNIKVLVPTLMISAALCGFGGAVLWSGQGVRLSAKNYRISV